MTSNFLQTAAAQARRILAERGECGAAGLHGSARALFLGAFLDLTRSSALIVCRDHGAAGVLANDLRFFSPRAGDVLVFPPLGEDGEAGPGGSSPADAGHERIRCLHRLVHGGGSVVVASLAAAAEPVVSPDLLERSIVRVEVGGVLDVDRFTGRLVDAGYSAVSLVVEAGEFCRRGGILDVFSPLYANPLRVELEGDEVVSLREFEVDTQRSIRLRDDALVLPVRETAEGREGATLIDFLPPEAAAVLDDPASFPSRESGEVLSVVRARLAGGILSLAATGREEIVFDVRTAETLGVRVGQKTAGPRRAEGGLKGAFGETFERLVERIQEWRTSRSVFWLSPNQPHAERLKDILSEYEIPAVLSHRRDGAVPMLLSASAEGRHPVHLIVGSVSSGFAWDEAGIVLLTEEDVFGPRVHPPPPRRKGAGAFLESFRELSVGDFVVHVDHGIGRYEGLKRLTVGGITSDFLVLRYAGDNAIYVPVEKLDRVQKYAGSEGQAPRLDRLGGAAWNNAKQRVRERAREIAADLLKIYARREVAVAEFCAADDALLREFETTFEYEETPDQLAAIEDVKKDLERSRPMDRLVCGDVGYGKTEVALRAVFKVVENGMQAALLVPTTILARQHFETFVRRFAPFPVRVEMLSRFRSPAEQRGVLKGLADGSVDVVIGTHRLLSKDVRFARLGLVVVDEEQRFGVVNKERLKQLRSRVHILTLTATPIPRTLQMSFLGIRDLSIIETPPENRLPIQTFVVKFDRAVMAEAVRRELRRGGQVFVVHNRVETIAPFGKAIQDAVPEARVRIAHGQMRESELESVMMRFYDGEFDVLVATTIIESGLDIPTVNTIVVHQAHRFGLAQLYQLRGRVGRAGVQAQAYLMVPEEETLSDTALKRLKVLQEYSDLGSGFAIAGRDLEIRGAGNLLGGEQSGHIAEVGYDLYVELLEQAVRDLRGEEVEEEVEPTMALPVTALFPDAYVPDLTQRLVLYKRLSGVRNEDELFRLRDETRDRYGEIPEEGVDLFRVMEIKVLGRALAAQAIAWLPAPVHFGVPTGPGRCEAVFAPSTPLSVERLIRYVQAHPGRAELRPPGTLSIVPADATWRAAFEALKNCLQALR
ncbi:MAG: transcription-repair coupling factor [Nitrospirae bacterium]|nr:transcription-repair coupling factor [Nitrospirota bacterium]